MSDFDAIAQLPELPYPDNIRRIEVPGASVRLGGYLVTPVAAEPLPADALPGILVLHAWGLNALAATPWGQQLANAGCVALVLSQRGFWGSEGYDDLAGAQVDDALAALDWLAGLHAVDPDRLAVLGFAQGGQVGLLAAARAPTIRAVAAYAAPSDMTRWAETTEYPGIPKHIAKHCPTPEARAARSPLAHAAAIRCPTLLIHGAADVRVPVSESERLFEAINAAGGQAHLAMLPGAEHMFDDETHGHVWGQVIAFYREALAREESGDGNGA